MDNCLSLILKNNLAEVARLLETLESFGKSNNFSDSSIFDISLVLDEIITNIIMHGYQDEEEHLISVNISLDKNSFSAHISDDGMEFNPLSHTNISDNIDIENIAIGGLGIQIIIKYVDKIEYQRISDKNNLSIDKNIEFIESEEKH